MAEPCKIAVFASRSGSNFQAIADAIRAGKLPAGLELLVCDRPKARVVERAEALGVEVYAFRPKLYPDRESYEREILVRLREKDVALVVLAGYMRILTPVLVEAYAGRMLNIHPSLLPAFPGLDAIGQAYRHGVKVTGITVHFVDGGLDSGPILAQTPVEIREDDTLETLEQRMHDVEHKLYPEALRWVCEGRVRIDGRQVSVDRDS